MKVLHPKIEELRRACGGGYLTSRYVDQNKLEKRSKIFDDEPGENEIDVYVAIFGVKDSYGTIAVKGCFAKSIEERGPASAGNEKIIHLWMHDMKQPLGSLVKMVEDDYGLGIRIRFDVKAGDMPKRIFEQSKSLTVRQYSYGFRYIWERMEYNELMDGVLMYECGLYETSSISILSSNPSAMAVRTREDFEQHFADLGILSEDALRGLPVQAQIELRQIISQYKSLAERAKPEQPLPHKEPTLLKMGRYNIDVNKLTTK